MIKKLLSRAFTRTITKTGTGEWNTLWEYQFKVPLDYDEKKEIEESKNSYSLIAHLCEKYPYTVKEIERTRWP